MGKLLVLDIGGTFIKYGVADEQGRLMESTVGQTPSHADGSAQDFLDALRAILSETDGEGDIQSVSACIAGPFDFDRGVSLMKHKFEALYGHSLRPPFEEKHVPVTFLHDSTAFMLGEYYDGSLTGADNACCVMLGTGLGFAWVKDGKVCVDETQTPSLALWKTPYRDGIAEDYVSTRAIQRYFGKALPVKDIAFLARSGDTRAQAAFLTAGEHLSAILAEVITRLGCEKFALGGQIAKSADLFHLKLPVPWTTTAHPDDAALRGVCRYAALGKEKCVRTITLDFGPLGRHPA
ncbi:MAG: ROK family protein [Clostridia bacterium]|nr:ROK family protein [Clostridia bacterium]